MKRKFLMVLTLIMVMCSTIGLTACVGNNDNAETPPHTHEYTILKHNATEHWYECSCGDKTDIENHKGGTATETQRPVCKDCHTEYGENLGHVHTLHLTKVDAKPQSCTATGNIEYYTCSCGKWFTDNTAETEIVDKSSVVIEKDEHQHATLNKTATEHWWECSCADKDGLEEHHGGNATCTEKAVCDDCGIEYGTTKPHSYTILKQSATQHWYECTCGAYEIKENHNPGAEATETTDQKCTECGYVITPALGHVHTLHLTKADAKPQSCTKEGNIEYYTCSCGKWFTDNTATTEITDKSSIVIAKDNHKHNILKHNETEHWYECSCGDKTGIENHKGGTATETEKAVCSVCNQEYGENLGHVHTLHLTKVDAKPQSCTKEGNIEYYTCSCDKWFTDNTATTEITDKTSVVIAKDNHKHSILKYNATEHWYECACGDKATAEGHKGGTATCQVKATCSVCGEKYGTLGSHQPKTEWATTETHHYHECKTSGCTEKLNYGEHNFDSNKKCSGCDYVTTALLGTEISSNVYEICGTNLFVKVPNAQTNFSFAKTINVAKGATYKVYTDISCKEEYCIPSYVVNDLKEENNVYYFLVSNKDEIPQVYTVTVRRRPKYTVTFNTDGGSYVAPQTIEEDALAVKPNNPTKTGYDFASWDYDFTMPIITNKTIKASWNARNDTPYRVEYYLENLENDNYSILSSATENLTGTTNSTVYADIKTFEHFTAEKTSVSGVVAANGTSVLKVYYQRDEYTVTFDGNGGTLISGEEVQKVKYGGSAAAPTYEKEGYTLTEFDKSLANIKESYTTIADWRINQYTITIVYGNGQEDKIITQEYNTIITETLPTIVEGRQGYTFNGWDSEMPNIMPSQNSTINASWLAIFNVFNGSITGLTTHGETFTEINIPETIDGVKITSIYNAAFRYCDSLTSVEIPNSVTNIGHSAFYGCSGLTSIEIPNSVTSIEGYAFWGCRRLTNVTIGSGVTSIGYEAFYECTSLTSIVIPNSVTSIAEYAFFGCRRLINVTIGSGVTRIGDWAFSECPIKIAKIPTFAIASIPKDELKEVVVTGGEGIGNSAFYDCHSLTSIEIPNSVTTIGYRAFSHCVSLKEIEIPDGVTSIGKKAFAYCECLTNIKMPNSLEYIGDEAFYGCDSFISVDIPNSVEDIGENAFGSCNALSEINISNSYYMSIDGVLYHKMRKALVQYPAGKQEKSFVLPNNITSISGYAFKDCNVLTHIEIQSQNDFWIDEGAFSGCSSVQSMTLPFVGATERRAGAKNQYPFGYIFGSDSYSGGTTIEQRFYGNVYNEITKKMYCIPDTLTSVKITGGNILYGAFYNCSNLIEIEIPKDINVIYDSAFEGCRSLTSIEIPSSVTSIGSSAFSGCSELIKVNYLGTIDSWVQIDFASVSANPLCWAENLYINNVLITSTKITTSPKISNYAFYNCESLKEIEILDSVTSIGEKAFYGCSSLTSIEIPNSVTSIGEKAFYGCSSLTSVVLPNSVISIGEEAFYGCSSLTSIEIPNSVTSIGDYAFYNCSKLTSIEIPNSVTSIGKKAFYGCTSLTNVVIPNSVEVIGSNAFSDCPIKTANIPALAISSIPQNVLEEVVITGGESIEEQAFYNCSLLTNVKILEGIINIGNSAFQYCNSLTSIEVPNSVTSIGDHAFYGCSQLQSVEVPNSLQQIGVNVFYKCESLVGNIKDDLQYLGNDENLYICLIKAIRSDLKEANIENGCKFILASAFYNCSSLTNVKIPDSVIDIGQAAFSGCVSLVGISIPEGVIDIKYNTFRGCSSLRRVIMPRSIVAFGDYSFYECAVLKTVYYKGDKESWKLISAGKLNAPVLNAIRYYYIENQEDVPTDGGNYWHYDENGNPVIW